MIHQKLNKIQTTLSAPKNQRNSFGGYNYRSCEDILEALKPLLKETQTVLTLSDDVRIIGDRVYVAAIATITDCEDGSFMTATGFARESLAKKGMDDSQITGTASSYARKYALNGLFSIDDNKDSDTGIHPQTDAPKPKSAAPKTSAPKASTSHTAYTNANLDDLPF